MDLLIESVTPVPALAGQLLVRVLATDGVNTGEDVSDGFLTGFLTVIGHVYLPLVCNTAPSDGIARR